MTRKLALLSLLALATPMAAFATDGGTPAHAPAAAVDAAAPDAGTPAAKAKKKPKAKSMSEPKAAQPAKP